MTSIHRLPDKQRRSQRRKNHIAKDLRTPKYGQRRVEDKKKIRDLTHRELVELINEKSGLVEEEAFETKPVKGDLQ